jgi:hypothetical protein
MDCYGLYPLQRNCCREAGKESVLRSNAECLFIVQPRQGNDFPLRRRHWNYFQGTAFSEKSEDMSPVRGVEPQMTVLWAKPCGIVSVNEATEGRMAYRNSIEEKWYRLFFHTGKVCAPPRSMCHICGTFCSAR